MPIRSIIEIGLAVLMAIGLIGILIRIFYRDKQEKPGITARTIQFLGLTFLIPAILILGLEQILSGETIAALVGAIVGYLLSSMAEYVPGKASITAESEQE